jgi:uncharacterized membrane protein
MTFAISLYGWVLSLHLLSAFALVGALVLFMIALVAARRIENPDAVPVLGRIVGVGTAALRAGLVGTVVFGVWLVFVVKGYTIWKGWILAALILWIATGVLGDRSVVLYKRAARLAESGAAESSVTGREPATAFRGRALLGFRLGALLAAIAILALMIWKPGA